MNNTIKNTKICDLRAPIAKAQQVEFFERKLVVDNYGKYLNPVTGDYELICGDTGGSNCLVCDDSDPRCPCCTDTVPLSVSEIALDDGVHYICLADTYRDACIGRARLIYEMDEDTLSNMHYMADLSVYAA